MPKPTHLSIHSDRMRSDPPGDPSPDEGMTHAQALRYWQDQLGEQGAFGEHFRIEKQTGAAPKFFLEEVAA